MKRILILEDEYYLAIELSEVLERENWTVVGPYGSLQNAMDAEDHIGIDAAVVDINLRGEMAFEFIDALKLRGIPVVIVTGYFPDMLPERFKSDIILPKPLRPEQLLSHLRTAVTEGEESLGN